MLVHATEFGFRVARILQSPPDCWSPIVGCRDWFGRCLGRCVRFCWEFAQGCASGSQVIGECRGLAGQNSHFDCSTRQFPHHSGEGRNGQPFRLRHLV